MSDPSPTPTGWTRRRVALFALAMSPVLALMGLLAWGLVATGGAPGGLAEFNETAEQPVTLQRTPSFSGFDISGAGVVNNASLAGKVVLVDFWSSWCVACRLEAESLAAVYGEYAGRGVEFVGIAIWDEAGASLRHIERYGVGYPNLLDAEGRLGVSFGVRGVPEKFFLDRQGRIVRKIIGPLSPEALRAALDALLAS
jgi:cytochrome c biogenesis protein CcmG/thiol:disulfide interchange protein DsbE